MAIAGGYQPVRPGRPRGRLLRGNGCPGHELVFNRARRPYGPSRAPSDCQQRLAAGPSYFGVGTGRQLPAPNAGRPAHGQPLRLRASTVEPRAARQRCSPWESSRGRRDPSWSADSTVYQADLPCPPWPRPRPPSAAHSAARRRSQRLATGTPVRRPPTPPRIARPNLLGDPQVRVVLTELTEPITTTNGWIHEPTDPGSAAVVREQVDVPSEAHARLEGRRREAGRGPRSWVPDDEQSQVRGAASLAPLRAFLWCQNYLIMPRGAEQKHSASSPILDNVGPRTCPILRLVFRAAAREGTWPGFPGPRAPPGLLVPVSSYADIVAAAATWPRSSSSPGGVVA